MDDDLEFARKETYNKVRRNTKLSYYTGLREKRKYHVTRD